MMLRMHEQYDRDADANKQHDHEERAEEPFIFAGALPEAIQGGRRL